MAIDGIGSTGFMPSSFPDVGSTDGVDVPPPMPDVGGTDDVSSPAGDFGFSGESGFDAGQGVAVPSMLASQRPPSPETGDDVGEAPSALSALSGRSDFEASPEPSAPSADPTSHRPTGGDGPATNEAREVTAREVTRRTAAGAGEHLARGSRGADVRQLQAQLRRAGFDPGPLDGSFGPRTEAAVRRFQQARGLDDDGIVGPRSRGALGRAPRSAVDQTTASRAGATSPVARTGAASPGGSGRTQEFLLQALSQNGNRYVFGAEANPNDPKPRALDCSELVEWAAARAGVRFPDGSANQIAAARPLSVEQALNTPGALLYRPGHIAISLGDGRTIEARNSRAGVGIFNAHGRGWTRAGTIPGMR